MPNPFVLLPPKVARAQADPPIPAWGFGEQLRVRNLGDNAGGLPDGGARRRDPARGRGAGAGAVQPRRQPDGGLARPAQDLRGHAGPRPERHPRHQDVGHRQAVRLRHRAQALPRGRRHHDAERDHLGLRRGHHRLPRALRPVRAGGRRSARGQRGGRGVGVLLRPGPAAGAPAEGRRGGGVDGRPAHHRRPAPPHDPQGPHPARRGEAASPRQHLGRPLHRGARRRRRAGPTSCRWATS